MLSTTRKITLKQEMNSESSKLIELESRFTYQEQTLEQLSQVVFEQSKQIEELKLKCADLGERLTELAASIPESNKDEKPPHY